MLHVMPRCVRADHGTPQLNAVELEEGNRPDAVIVVVDVLHCASDASYARSIQGLCRVLREERTCG